MKCMHLISRDRGHSEGRGVGVNGRLEAFQKFICFGSLTPPLNWYDYQSLHQSVSCLDFFSIQLLKKNTLNPENTLLDQFHAQKALFKIPQICNITVKSDMEFVRTFTPPDFKVKKFYTVNFTLFQQFQWEKTQKNE